jgi:hypothetical protein
MLHMSDGWTLHIHDLSAHEALRWQLRFGEAVVRAEYPFQPRNKIGNCHILDVTLVRRDMCVVEQDDVRRGMKSVFMTPRINHGPAPRAHDPG